MAQITSGLRKVLSLPMVYNLWGILLGAERATRDVVERYLRVNPGENVFDIGCGTGKLLEAFPEGVNYTGFDLSRAYIEDARKKYGQRGRFIHADVGTSPDIEAGSQDLAVATGVLHHLNDAEVIGLFQLARRVLKPGGRLVTLDSVFMDGQPRVARYLISRDRGQNVRQIDEYLALARSEFDEVTYEIREDLLRIPYTHIIITSRK